VVDVADGADIDMRLAAVKLCLAHFLISRSLFRSAECRVPK
jgi:hypothetical protein